MKVSKTLLATAALAIAPFAFAQEAQTVSAPATEAPAAGDTTKITIEVPKVKFAEVKDVVITPSAMIQMQYAYAHTSHESSSDDTSMFFARRTNLGVTAKTKDGWTLALTYEFDEKENKKWESYVDKAVISKKTDAGTLSVGHKKAHFGVEEYSSSSSFLCIERSLNSNYLNGKGVKGLSGRHTGIDWAGKINDFDYGIALTNAKDEVADQKSNDFAITYNVGQKIKFADKHSLYIGFNGAVNFGDEGGNYDNGGTVYGFEPYIQYQNGGLNLMAIGYYVNGENKTNISEFYGINLTAAYKLDCGLEPAFRFTYLNTSDGNVKANYQKNVPTSDGYNNAYTAFAGVNYYFNKNVKLAAGYEYGRLFGGNDLHSAAEFSAVRTMLQIKF